MEGNGGSPAQQRARRAEERIKGQKEFTGASPDGAWLLARRMAVAAGSAEPKALDGIEGKDITLPDKLMGTGALIRRSSPSESQTCLRVLNGDVMTRSCKVSWNSSTGDVTVKNLQKNDSSQLVLEIWNSSHITYITYNLTVSTPAVTPPGNKWLWFLLVPILVLVFAGLGCYFGPCKKEEGCNPPCRDGGSDAGPPPTVNGYKEGRPMKTEDSSV